MRRKAVVASVATALCILAGVAYGQGQFELQYRRFRQSIPPGFGTAQQFLGALPGPPFRVRTPDLSGDAVYFTHTFGDREIVFLVDSGKKAKLYVDVDGDKDLAEEKGLESKYDEDSGTYVFGAVTIPGRKPGGDIEFRARAYGGGETIQYLFIEPAGIRTGVCELDGVEHRLRILDANLDGRYDGVLNPADPYTQDWYVLVESGSPARASAGDARPLPRIFKLDDQWYSFVVLPDGSAVTFEPVEPEFGALDVGTGSAEVRLLSDTGVYHLEGSDGRWELPEGRYVAQQIVLKAQDGEDTWQLSAYGSTGELEDFAIEPDKTVAADIGGPLTVKTNVAIVGPSQAQIGLVVTGQAGEQYSPGSTKDGQMVEAPTYKIFDEAGELLSSGRFEYG